MTEDLIKFLKFAINYFENLANKNFDANMMNNYWYCLGKIDAYKDIIYKIDNKN